MIEITNAYIIGNSTYEIDEKNVIVAKVNYLEVMQAFEKLRVYEKQNENRDGKFISRIN